MQILISEGGREGGEGLLVDLNLAGKNVVVAGGGREAEFKVRKILEAGPKLTVVSKRFSKGLKDLRDKGMIQTVKGNLWRKVSLLTELNPYVAVIATDDPDLNRYVAERAKEGGALVCAVDAPNLNDFNMPAVASFGDIQVGILTGGKSPAMARLLRQRLEKMISEEDLLQVRLQEYARRIAKGRIPDQTSRKRALYRIMRNSRIKGLLKRKRFNEARSIAKQIILQ